MSPSSDLIRVIQKLARCRRLEEVVSTLRDAARELTGADGVTVVLREGDFVRYVDESAISPLWKGRRFPIDECISGWVVLHGRQVAIPDVYADARVPHDAYRRTFVHSLVMTPIRGDEIVGALGAYWSQEHEASEEERALLGALADSAAVAMANAQLIEELEQSARRKDDLLSMLAHELRNPLAPLRNALHVLRLQPDEKSARRARDVMERQVDHLGRMIDDLLDVALLRKAKVEVRRERVDLRRLVEEATDDRRGAMESAGVSLAISVPASPVWVQADRVRLLQALGNVLDNATKFTPRGGKVSLALGARGDEALLRVRDDGMGIAPELLPHVFEPFVQHPQGLGRERGGLGLGLAIASGIVALHDGTLRAASDGPGSGAQFTLRMPLDAEPPALADGEAAATTTSAATRIANAPGPRERRARARSAVPEVDAGRGMAARSAAGV
jgi:two-component system CheB/CheR fusion protein